MDKDRLAALAARLEAATRPPVRVMELVRIAASVAGELRGLIREK